MKSVEHYGMAPNSKAQQKAVNKYMKESYDSKSHYDKVIKNKLGVPFWLRTKMPEIRIPQGVQP